MVYCTISNMKILLVGSGVTSAVTGVCIRNMLPECNLYMWDKARGTGGRMITSRCVQDSNCIADVGAQYITTTDEFMKSNQDIYKNLLSEGHLEPLKCKVIGMKPQGSHKNFIAPAGTGSLVKQLLKKGNINETKFEHHVSSINKEGSKWIVETKAGKKEDFDVVILTMPVPQLFLLEGSVMNELDSSVIYKLKAVTYSARYALILFFLRTLSEDWGARYFDQDPVFRYVSIDNIKRNHPAGLSAAVFHTTVPFGLSHVEESIPDIEKVLLSRAKSLFPGWPEPDSVKCHKWRYSQVTNTYADSLGCLTLSENPPIIIGGDGFMGSTFDNCIKSSKAISEKLKLLLNLS